MADPKDKFDLYKGLPPEFTSSKSPRIVGSMNASTLSEYGSSNELYHLRRLDELSVCHCQRRSVGRVPSSLGYSRGRLQFDVTQLIPTSDLLGLFFNPIPLHSSQSQLVVPSSCSGL